MLRDDNGDLAVEAYALTGLLIIGYEFLGLAAVVYIGLGLGGLVLVILLAGALVSYLRTSSSNAQAPLPNGGSAPTQMGGATRAAKR
jgi:hypothetical protein